MRALRVVGITEGDGKISVVLEDPGRHERFTVAADEQLRAASRGDLARLGQIAIELESQLRPREIQARIRAGASVEQVAAIAGVPEQKIERFAYPVLLERSRTAEVAQRAHPVRAEGPDSRMLGDVVAHTFGLRGQEYTGVDWDSWKGEDGRWVVALSWRAGRSDNRAHWTFQPGAHGGTVIAIDEHASDLVEGLPARPLRTVGPVIDIARTEEPAPAASEELRAVASSSIGPWDRARPSADRATGDRTPADRGADRAATDRDAADRVSADRSAVDRTRYATEQRGAAPPAQRRVEASPPTMETRSTEPRNPEPTIPVPQPAATQPAATQLPAERPLAPPPAVEQPVETGTPATDEPAPSDPAPAAGRRTKKGKPVMPSWDEVLLGVRGQR